jgi:3-phosphoshikimate 1-carboxyvinyltransferase
MNVDVELNGDLMTIKGGSEIKGAKVSSHNDHRIAMATAIAALAGKGNTIIENAEAVKKSYPDFYKDLKAVKLNANASKKKDVI